MSSDSGGKPEWELNWEADQRREFQTDPAMWLRERFNSVTHGINEQSAQEKAQAKKIAQNIAESIGQQLEHKHDSLVVWIGILTTIALASAELWIGGGLVGLIVIWVWWRSRAVWKQVWRLQRFRQRFRELLKEADSGLADMSIEDEKVLRKYEDSILYPLAVPEHERERPTANQLEQIETLYREYCASPDHDHVGGPGLPAPPEMQKKHLESCQLCQAARRVREHVESTLSSFEGEIARWRERLVTRIDGGNPEGVVPTKEFMESFRSWSGPLGEGSEIRALIEWLRDKEQWTFDHADKVRGACREGEEWQSENDYASRTFDKLSREMEEAAAHSGLGVEWKHYDTLIHGFWDGHMRSAVKQVRRIIGRSSPEVLFREFTDDGYGKLAWINRELESLKNYGYNGNLVEHEVLAAKKFLTKEGRKWDKCYAQELAAAKTFAWLEEMSADQRNEERNNIPWSRPDPLTFRIGRTVGKLLGRQS